MFFKKYIWESLEEYVRFNVYPRLTNRFFIAQLREQLREQLAPSAVQGWRADIHWDIRLLCHYNLAWISSILQNIIEQWVFLWYSRPEGWVTSGQVRHTTAWIWSGSSCDKVNMTKCCYRHHYDIMTGSASGRLSCVSCVVTTIY